MSSPERRAWLVAAVVAAVVSGAWAADPKPGGSGFFDEKFGNKKEPITVTSDTLEYDYKANVVAIYIHAERAEAEARTLLGELPLDDRWDRANALDMDARALIILERYKDAQP